MEKTVRRGVFGGRTVLAACLAVSLALPGCAGNGNDDMTGALLIGAAVVGLGVLAATAGDDDDDRSYERDRRRHRSDGYHNGGYYGNGHYGERGRDGYSRYAGNGQCDDGRYRTSNGGRAESGTDEWDCRRFGDGRK
ncbi:hypothetical protein [Azospirillum lipoferum]|uniref:Lipoprotein n=1 Tax=Azospirillum lipoferum (strain 4B) TaxID=862719 RepID=G7ZF32_AZOL4|nr:hypothetical protein [Azospirillum lipoferum]CBS90012.1 protein of unknown function [Azospirillum lipoferum 4B]